MNFKAILRSRVAAWLTSEARLNGKRRRAEFARRLARRPHEILYFHRSDDPYCQLMVQVLPELAYRFDVKITPLVVEKLPANMYPDPARFEGYSIIDAARLAKLYGLGFPATASVPDRLSVGMANRYLASVQNDPKFFSIAQEVGAALWREDLLTVRKLCVVADIDEQMLVDNEKRLRDLGQYSSASLYYEGEFYVGIDRIDHLERRLNRLGLGDGECHFDLTRIWRHRLETLDKSVAGRTVEFFFSVRSPYSHLSLQQVSEFAELSGINLKIKPVMPMLMRGMQVPATKGRYILSDAAREARLEDIPFGKIVDPLGLAVKRAMGIGFSLPDDQTMLRFFSAFTRGVWAEGIDGTTDEGLLRIIANAGLPPSTLTQALPEEMWMEKAERNMSEMLVYGSWGVPTFRVANETLWGQDRLWAIAEILKNE